MGFKQDRSKKLYYVDGHEKPEQVQHRSQFITTFLTEIEPHSHRWVSLGLDEYKSLQLSLGEDKILAAGY